MSRETGPSLLQAAVKAFQEFSLRFFSEGADGARFSARHTLCAGAYVAELEAILKRTNN